MAITVFALFMYVTVFPLTLFENRFIVCDTLRRPIWFTKKNQTIFFLAKSTLAYGSMILIGYSASWWFALAAFIAIYIFNKITFNVSYNKQLCKLADDYYRIMEKDPRFGKGDDEKTLRLRGLEIAKDVILRNMKGEG